MQCNAMHLYSALKQNSEAPVVSRHIQNPRLQATFETLSALLSFSLSSD